LLRNFKHDVRVVNEKIPRRSHVLLGSGFGKQKHRLLKP